MVTSVTHADVRDLAKVSGLCVSIYVPASMLGRDRLENPIRLKNEIEKAHRLLIDGGMRPTLALDLLEPGAKLVQTPEIWDTPCPGLAMFFTESSFRWYWLPYSVPQLTVVGPKFHVRPLLSVLDQERCYILAIDEKRVRLIEVFGESVKEVHPPDMPRSLQEALGPEYSEKQRQMHSIGAAFRHPSAVSHGAGDPAADQKDKDGRYCQAVDRAVTKFLSTSLAPLILAATEPLLSIYRGKTHYGHVVDESLAGWPGRKTDLDLALAAKDMIGRIRDKRVRELLDVYEELEPVGRTVAGVEGLIPAAASGMVQYLFADKNAVRWGFVDGSGNPKVVESQEAWAEDLINRAAIETLANGGHVIELDAETAPLPGGAVGTLRY